MRFPSSRKNKCLNLDAPRIQAGPPLRREKKRTEETLDNDEKRELPGTRYKKIAIMKRRSMFLQTKKNKNYHLSNTTLQPIYRMECYDTGST